MFDFFSFMCHTELFQGSPTTRYISVSFDLSIPFQKYSFSASSSRKLAKSLKLNASKGGHVEIAPSQPSNSAPPPPSQSFTREAAPHTTRVPVPLRSKLSRRPVERWSSDRRRSTDKNFRDHDRGKGRLTERRYGQGQTFEGRQDSSGGDKRYESYRHYLERRDSRDSCKYSRSPSHTKKSDFKGLFTARVDPSQSKSEGRKQDKEPFPGKFHHPPQLVSLAPSSPLKGKSKVQAGDDAPLAEQFTSPPLLPGLLDSLKEMIGIDARPTPIQSLSLKWLLGHPDSSLAQSPNVDTTSAPWRQFLLASETGSGKSIAYLLPLLQNLKQSELASKHLSSSSSQPSYPQVKQRPYNPRGLVLAPTHELSRQLSGFAKSLLHGIKLRVLCASQANQKSTSRHDSTSSKMSSKFSDVSAGPLGEFQVAKSTHPVDILFGTPMKVLEMVHGRGWDRKEIENESDEVQTGVEGENETAKKPRRGRDKMIGFGKWRSKPELGLANIEWVVVDEADVLFGTVLFFFLNPCSVSAFSYLILDPDFQETTRTLLANISAARGHPIPIFPSTHLSSLNAQPPTPLETSEPINYPFNLLLTSATIPNSLSLYLKKHHPSLIRLASPRLHHLPKTLQTEYVDWSGGNKLADVERRIRRVWAEDSANHNAATSTTLTSSLSKILVFCNKSSKVIEMSEYLNEKGIKNVAMTSQSEHRGRGSNKHLAGFLRKDDDNTHTPAASTNTNVVKDSPHVMITTSLLSRGLDFSSSIKHVFIVDEPRNMIDFLHRAGRAGRAGQKGKVVVFGKMSGRGSSKAKDVRRRVGALTL